MHSIISNVRPECQPKKIRVVCPLLDVLDATTMGYKLILEKTEGSINDQSRDTDNICCKTQNRQIKQNTQCRKLKNEQHGLHKKQARGNSDAH